MIITPHEYAGGGGGGGGGQIPHNLFSNNMIIWDV